MRDSTESTLEVLEEGGPVLLQENVTINLAYFRTLRTFTLESESQQNNIYHGTKSR